MQFYFPPLSVKQTLFFWKSRYTLCCEPCLLHLSYPPLLVERRCVTDYPYHVTPESFPTPTSDPLAPRFRVMTRWNRTSSTTPHGRLSCPWPLDPNREVGPWWWTIGGWWWTTLGRRGFCLWVHGVKGGESLVRSHQEERLRGYRWREIGTAVWSKYIDSREVSK